LKLQETNKLDFFWIYFYEKDFDHNFVSFSSSNFFIFPDLKEFLDKNDNINLNLIPDPSISFFGFYFSERNQVNIIKKKINGTLLDKETKSLDENNYYTYDM
jgi:hypothetical protein